MSQISSDKHFKHANAVLMDHLKARIMLSGEEILGKALEHINYDPERLKFTVEGSNIHVSTIYSDQTYRYNRAFPASMIFEEYRWMFVDFSSIIKDALVNNTAVLISFVNTVESYWGEELTIYLLEVLDVLNSESITGGFSWQVVGSTKFSVEFSENEQIFIFPLILLHYLHLVSGIKVS